MIKVESILIENFRGIRKLQIPIGGQSLVIKGPNGSGKSGVIDAIEFGLTGTITRLTGVGSSGVSVKSHAPHVDCKDAPEKCRVVLDLSLPSGTKFSVERTVAAHNKPTVTPETLETKAALQFITSHPEFSLSRKEILRFILTEPGQRAKEVQELLKLDSIGKIRASLQTASNTAAREEKAADASHSKAKADLLAHLKLPELTKEALLKSVNERRILLGLSALSDVTADVKVSDGIASDSKEKKRTISKTDCSVRVSKLKTNLDKPWGKTSVVKKQGSDAIISLESNPEILQSLSQQTFFEQGLLKIVNDSCPLCDEEWDQGDLRTHLQEKIKKGQQAAAVKSAIEKAATETVQVIRTNASDFEQLTTVAQTLGLVEVEKALKEAASQLRDLEASLLRPVENLAGAKNAFNGLQSCIADTTKRFLDTLEAEVNKLPDLTAEEGAKQYLVLADERLRLFRSARSEHDVQKKRAAIATATLAHFTNVSEKTLTTLYSQVEKDFARYYQMLNSDDEAGFSAKLSPTDGSLNFEVDFYGRGQFPPNAYHSEGHQDGMGLCLYLALSKRLLGESFSLCLLDDVLMSVDSSHRREVCKLLKTEFQSVQLIITTHDEVWGKQLSLEGVVTNKNLLHFRKWTVADGPAAWDMGEVWTEIEKDLGESKVTDAAGTLRRYLEFLMAELSFKLRATVEARPTANYELGDLMPAVAGRIKDIFKKANAAANSWNQKDVVEKVSALSSDFGSKYTATNAEQWAVNASVHYNEWVNLSPPEFRKVLDAFKALIATLQCGGCKAWLYVSPIKGQPETVRCECGTINFNLRPKQ
ncbi:MAG: AAA family ATPase [Bacteriovoracia bacterium]